MAKISTILKKAIAISQDSNQPLWTRKAAQELVLSFEDMPLNENYSKEDYLTEFADISPIIPPGKLGL